MLFRLRRLFKSAGRDIARLFYACRDPLTPRAVKVGATLLLLYLISPIDLIPETLPLLGVLDDITLATFAIPALLRLLPDAARRNADQASEAFISRLTFWR